MKKVFYLSMYLVAALAIVFSSCEKDESDEDEIIPTPENSFECEFDGSSYVAGTINVSVFMEKIIIGTSDESGLNSIGLTFDQDIEIDTYDFSLTGSVVGKYQKFDGTNMTSTSGTLEITKHDKELNFLEGTFEFIAEESTAAGGSYYFSNGDFVINY